MSVHQQDNQRQTTTAEKHPNLTLSVVIPALNEQDGIADILQRILAIQEALRRIGITGLEVIVVDDGSSDATGIIVQAIPWVRLISHSANRGYGAAIKTGFVQSSGELLAFLDADSTYPPEQIVKLCEVAIREDADLVIGSRRSGAESHMPFVRRIGNLIWSSLLSLIGDSRVEDPASGMRILRRNCLQQLYPLPNGLNFTPVMSTRALHEGLKVIEVPVPYRERSGQSKLSVVRDGMRFLKTILWTALQYNPARILELAGFGALAIAGLIGFLLILARLEGITVLGPLSVFGVFTCLILAVGGVSIFSLGISFNYLVALFHKRPIRQVNLIAKIVGHSPERYFGWAGLLLGAGGMTLGAASLVLGLRGWEITRLWLWQLGSALFLLVGVQCILFWMLIRVMDTLNEREDRIGNDMMGMDVPASVLAVRPEPLMNESRLY
jgi:glycosyltransferase involved in cell wall biosynthesis